MPPARQFCARLSANSAPKAWPVPALMPSLNRPRSTKPFFTTTSKAKTLFTPRPLKKSQALQPSAPSQRWTPSTAPGSDCCAPRSITSTASLPSAIFKTSCSRNWSACVAGRARPCLLMVEKRIQTADGKTSGKPSARASRKVSCVRWIGSRLSIPSWGQMFFISSAPP